MRDDVICSLERFDVAFIVEHANWPERRATSFRKGQHAPDGSKIHRASLCISCVKATRRMSGSGVDTENHLGDWYICRCLGNIIL